MILWAVGRFMLYSSYFAIFGALFGFTNFGKMVAIDNTFNGLVGCYNCPSRTGPYTAWEETSPSSTVYRCASQKCSGLCAPCSSTNLNGSVKLRPVDTIVALHCDEISCCTVLLSFGTHAVFFVVVVIACQNCALTRCCGSQLQSRRSSIYSSPVH